MNKKQLVCALVVLAGQLSLVASDNAPRKPKFDRRSSTDFWNLPSTQTYNEALHVAVMVLGRREVQKDPVRGRRSSFAQWQRFRQEDWKTILDADGPGLVASVQNLDPQFRRVKGQKKHRFPKFKLSGPLQDLQQRCRKHRASTTTGPKLREFEARFQVERAGHNYR